MYCDIPDLGRCCFCLPLRRGVLTFGYLNIFFSAFMIGVYSFAVNKDVEHYSLLYHGAVSQIAAEICIAIYCLELIFNILLVYGAHMKLILYVKIFYYYAITTTVATVLAQIAEFATSKYMFLAFEMAALTFGGLCIQVYLIISVRSLLKRLDASGTHVYENQLHQIVNGEVKIEGNGIYDTSTVIPNDRV